jgi:hypothetical protein
MAQTMISPHISDEIVSCYKDPAELALFHDVEMIFRPTVPRNSR